MKSELVHSQQTIVHSPQLTVNGQPSLVDNQKSIINRKKKYAYSVFRWTMDCGLWTALLLWTVVCGLLTFSSCKEKGAPSSDNTIAITGPATFSDTSSSTVKVFDNNGRVCIQQSNTYYELADVYDGAAKIPLLLKIRKTELCFADSVNKDKVYEIEAHSILDSKKIEWQTKFVATEMLFKDNSLYTNHEGGEGEEDLITRYSLLDGKEIFSCSYGELKAIIPNVKNKRFIGFTSQKAVTQPVQTRKEENLLGIVSYSSGTAAINSAKIILKRSGVEKKIPLSTPDMVLVPVNENTTTMEEGKSIVMMKADEHFKPTDITGFALQLTFYYGDDNESTIILIPVADDKLDIAKAKYDKDIFEITAW